MKAIVIDDDIDTVEVLSEFLELKGINVVGKGYNGRQAVELYEKHTPDIVLLDIMMPDYDGFYAISEIRKINSDVKILTITADISIKTKRKLNELRVSKVVFKPYDIDNILNIIYGIEDGQTIFLSL